MIDSDITENFMTEDYAKEKEYLIQTKKNHID